MPFGAVDERTRQGCGGHHVGARARAAGGETAGAPRQAAAAAAADRVPDGAVLLNLIAFEQLTEQRAGDVSAYAWFMAKLVRSPEDAAVVQRIMVGSGSHGGVARFFGEVGSASEAAGKLEQSYLRETLEQLRKRTMHPLLTKRADVQRYFINVPWRLVAAFVTVVTQSQPFCRPSQPSSKIHESTRIAVQINQTR